MAALRVERLDMRGVVRMVAYWAGWMGQQRAATMAAHLAARKEFHWAGLRAGK